MFMDINGRVCAAGLIVCAVLISAGCKGRVHPIYSQTPIKVSADQIYKEYQDEKTADAKYLGHLAEVTGVVDRTGMDSFGQFYALLKGGDAIGTVICYFPKKMNDMSAQVKPGQPITVRGIVLNRLMNVILDECVMVQG